jgi:hypothetical protein
MTTVGWIGRIDCLMFSRSSRRGSLKAVSSASDKKAICKSKGSCLVQAAFYSQTGFPDPLFGRTCTQFQGRSALPLSQLNTRTSNGSTCDGRSLRVWTTASAIYQLSAYWLLPGCCMGVDLASGWIPAISIRATRLNCMQVYECPISR